MKKMYSGWLQQYKVQIQEKLKLIKIRIFFFEIYNKLLSAGNVFLGLDGSYLGVYLLSQHLIFYIFSVEKNATRQLDE